MTLKKKIRHALRWATHHLKTIGVLGVALVLFFSGTLILWAISLPIPDFKAFDERIVTESTKIFDRTGKVLLYDVHGEIKRTRVPFEDISDNIKKATIAIEDDKFYSHSGVRPLSILRAAIANFTSGEFSQGGSTITQQLIKNSLLSQDKKISRKIKELLLSLKLEKIKTKDEILTLYLNEISYGGNRYGVEVASQTFFGKPAKEVTLAEAAYLAAIPKAPTYYSPYGNHTDKLENRKNLVLKRMTDLKMITTEERDRALAEKIVFAVPDQGIKAPHFVFMVIDYLENRFGEGSVENQGLRVITTIDYELQKKAEEAITKFAETNEINFKAKNGSMVAIDPGTGQILALVGSRDYFDTENDGNFNIALAHRQPGSAFKPFVYATAFNEGYTPETVLFDLETQFSTNCAPDDFSDRDGCYSPQNYDDKFRGPISLRDALAQSINIPAVKLLYLAGVKDSINTARSMGITSLTDPNLYGLTLVLGGGEVSLLEMTSAYGVFANDGVRNAPVSVLEIKDRNNQVLEKFTAKPSKVLPEQTARQISDILSNTAAPLNPNFIFPGRDVAAKTGTTNNYRDVWVVGYTPNLAVGAWVGNNDNTPMEKKVAGFIVAPVWGEFMKQALPSLPDQKFFEPEATPTDIKPIFRGFWQGGQTYVVDKTTGNKANENTPLELQEERVIPNVHTILYWLDRQNDSQYERWELPIQKWLQSGGRNQLGNTAISNTNNDVRKPEYLPKLEIETPENDAEITTSLLVVLDIDAHFTPLAKIDFFIDGKLIDSLKKQNDGKIDLKISTTDFDTTDSEHTLKVVVYDAYQNKVEDSVGFTTN